MIPWQQYSGDDLDYQVDFTSPLAGDTIASAQVTGSDGITIDRVSNTDTAVLFWITGGQPGVSATVTCIAVTAGGRQLEAQPIIDILT